MLWVKVAPEQVEKLWDIVSPAIENSLPPTSSEKNDMRMFNLKRSILAEAMDCWIAFKDNNPWILTILGYHYDPFTNDKNLLIYALEGFSYVSFDSWARLFKHIRAQAKDKDCNKIIAYSSLPRVTDIAKALGWNTEYKYLFYEV